MGRNANHVEWRDINGTNGLYQVSNNGDVRRIYKTKPHRVLKKIIDKDGYYQVNLSVNNKRRTARVHRLVAEAFIENPNGYPVINHKDENKINNYFENLEWCTVAHNTNYMNMPYRRAKPLRRPIAQFDLNGKYIRTWESRAEIERKLNVSGGNITTCCQGKQKTAYGFLWLYADQIAEMKAMWGDG